MEVWLVWSSHVAARDLEVGETQRRRAERLGSVATAALTKATREHGASYGRKQARVSAAGVAAGR